MESVLKRSRPAESYDDEESKKRERLQRFKRLKEAKKAAAAAVVVPSAKLRILAKHRIPIAPRSKVTTPFLLFQSSSLDAEPPTPSPVSQSTVNRERVAPPESKTSEPKVDPLDAYMVDVDKQMEDDITSTLNRLALIKDEPPKIKKRSITFEEIQQQSKNDDYGEESCLDDQTFIQALKNLKPQLQIVEGSAVVRGTECDGHSVAEDDLGRMLLGVDDDENQQGALDDFLKEDPENVEQSYFELLAQHGSKKELQPVDHSVVKYEMFKKNLYIQVREISLMKDHEVEALRRTHGNIRIRGKGCPRPIKEFTQAGLPDSLLNVLRKKGCEQPFPIQMQAIPALMAGRNVIGVAETGSGKTLAYLLPLIRHVMAQTALKEGEGPIALIIGPTRELVQQISQESKKYCAAVSIRCALVYGGGGIGTQLAELKRGAEIVVGTPGRLTEILTINRGRICNLRRVTFLVLDEADRMFDLGFGPQVERIISKPNHTSMYNITDNVRPDRQIAMFSATFPTHVESLAKRSLYKPLEIIVGEKGRTALTVTQFVEVLPDRETKFLRLLKILGEWYEHGESILIFASRQVEVDELCLQLGKFGYDALTLHGGQDQEERELSLSDFKQKRNTILIATSLASRGLDVRSVVLVINYVAPDHLEDYVHRIGRTGRAGNIGVAYTFFTPEEADRAEDVRRALSQSGQTVPPALDALVASHEAQVQCGMARARKTTGFGGRGYKFTAGEKSAQQEARQFWKKELGIVDAADDEVEGEGTNPDTPATANSILTESASSTGGVQAVAVVQPTPLVSSSGSGGSNSLASATKQIQESVINEINTKARALMNQWTAAILDPVKKAQQIEALLPTIRQIVAQQHPSAAGVVNLTSPTGQPIPDVAAMVQQALQPMKPGAMMMPSAKPPPAAAIPAKAGSSDYIDPTTNNFVTTLSINDYPPQARHRVSHKETLTHVSETTGAALQVRGVYVDPDKRRQTPGTNLGAKELHIEIVAATQVAAQRAKRELHTMLESVAKKQLNIPGGTAAALRRNC